MNYKDDIKIDKFDLDEESVKQPYLYMQYQEEELSLAKDLDDIKLEIDVVKNDLKEIESELWIQYKQELVNNKPSTDKFVEAKVLTDPARKKVFGQLIDKQRKLNQIKYDHGILLAVVKSFEVRKKSLEHLVQMGMSGYYSELSVKKQKIETNQNEINEELNK